MKIRVLPIRRLAAEHVQAWSEIQLQQSEFESPYFRPEYHQLAGAVGRPVFVGILEQGGEPVGFFPFERGAFGTGHPVGRRLSDFHGAIVATGTPWSGDELLRACGLRRFCFQHLLAQQTPLLNQPTVAQPSPVADLAQGYAAYRAELKLRGQNELERTVKKGQKTQRDIGTVQFTFHDTSAAVWQACLQWKAAQYERTGAFDVFRYSWVSEFLQRIIACESPHFAGCVSALRVNEQIVAVHIGMRSSRVLHHWFPSHDPEHPCAKYSPGLQMLVGMLEGAAAAGLQRLDFGAGDYRYKRDFSTSSKEVVEGECGAGILPLAVGRTLQDTRQAIRRAAESGGLDAPVRWYRNMRDWLVMR